MSGGWVWSVPLTADTVRVGDAISVGGRTLIVADLCELPGGAGKMLRFRSGERLTLHPRSELSASRIGPPPVRAYRRRRTDR
ncbi:MULTISPECIES: hypothetical protein [unclassified Streptomyces]|uniref:hypothetical protein n=1 Tax=unclassified Streptomyces TaxID=2593676 RepID=UPI001903B875|nr:MULTISPECIES: hypothetical protein [unclassified Streptomyces]MCU4749155.1 hypothetical protein [Streptomyces sp. G-5]QQN77300.1 hypothetical protein IPZ77_07415 [Streptomyces sp. XC 2026]